MKEVPICATRTSNSTVNSRYKQQSLTLHEHLKLTLAVVTGALVLQMLATSQSLHACEEESVRTASSGDTDTERCLSPGLSRGVSEDSWHNYTATMLYSRQWQATCSAAGGPKQSCVIDNTFRFGWKFKILQDHNCTDS